MKRAGQLALPFLNLALLALYVEVDDAMGIREVEFRNCSSEGNGRRVIEYRQAVVCDGQCRNEKNARCYYRSAC